MDWILLLSALGFFGDLKDKVLGPFIGWRQDIDLLIIAFKVVILLFIVSFVRGRFGGGPIVTVLIFVLGYIMLFQSWYIFGPMMFIYLFIVFGFSAILFDVAITKPWQDHGAMMEGHTPEDRTGHHVVKESAERREVMKKRMGF
jgi:hypothetical protein